MASQNKNTGIAAREAPPVLIIAAVVVVVLALGTGAFVAYNGGWKTRSQQDYQFKHEVLPLYAAKHGNTTALDEENKLRKAHGEAPLEVTKEKGSGATADPDALKKLQDQLRAKGAGQ